MKNRQIILLFLCLLWLLPSKAQKKDSIAEFSLRQAVDYALKHQTNILNAEIDQKIADNTVKKTIGIGLPQVNGSASFQNFIKIPTSLLPGEIVGQPKGTMVPVQFGTNYNSSATLEASQLIFSGSYLVGLQASRVFKELSIKNYNRSKIETAVAVTKAYYSVSVSNEQLNLLDANLIRLQKALSDTKELFKNGFVEQIDVDRLSVIYNNLTTERENVVRLLELNSNLLKFQMGMPIDTKATFTDKINVVSNASEAVEKDSTAYKNRIEYSLLQTQKKLNELDLKRYQSEFLPTLAGFFSTSANYLNNSFSDLYRMSFPTTVVGLKLSLPIISGGQRIYQVRNAKLEILKTNNSILNLQNAINLETAQAKTSYINGQKSLENQKRNMDLAQEILRVTKFKYEQGVGSSLEVVTAETSLKETQTNYINALFDLLISKVNLDKALGKFNY
ncbi:MAG: TolC family protein [Sphingobacteriaceae bacterium]|nr:TolC family protein [Sphingobacteriaceae bacterium]